MPKECSFDQGRHRGYRELCHRRGGPYVYSVVSRVVANPRWTPVRSSHHSSVALCEPGSVLHTMPQVFQSEAAIETVTTDAIYGRESPNGTLPTKSKIINFALQGDQALVCREQVLALFNRYLEIIRTHLFLSISSAWRCSCLTRSRDILSSPPSSPSVAGSRWSRP
jgi:hypothetical protein